MTPTLIALCTWAFVASVASLSLSTGPSIACLSAGLMPFCLWSWRQIRRDLRERRALASVAGIANIRHARFSHFQSSTGIVLNPAQRTLTLSSGSQAKRYRYADVREWKIKPQTEELQFWMHDAEQAAWHIAMPIEQTQRDWAGYLLKELPMRISATGTAAPGHRSAGGTEPRRSGRTAAHQHWAAPAHPAEAASAFP